MAKENTADELNAGDVQARRLVALMLSFANAHHPLSSEEVRASHYPELSNESFLRQFSRDRARLAEAGLVITRERHGREEAYWHAEQASFADVSRLSASDALLVDVLCAPLASDPSFARRSELRHALAKLDGSFGKVTAARVSNMGELPALSALLECMERRVTATVRYVDAQGRKSERAYAPFGSFGLRGHTYVVCALVGTDGVVDERELRSLRDDRLVRVTARKDRYEIPVDFEAESSLVLPFQIGPSVGVARLRAVEGTSSHAISELCRRSAAEGTPSDGPCWELPLSSVDDAAAWAVASGVVPESPPELVAAWRELLRAASALEPDPSVGGPVTTSSPAKRMTRGAVGRPSADLRTRELIALIGALRDQGSSITAGAISTRLGVSPERARELIMLILTSCTSTSAQLPLGISEDEDELVLCFARGVHGRPLRFTRGEAAAVEDALDLLGLPRDDALRDDVRAAYGPSGVDELGAAASRERVDASLAHGQSEILEACSHALIEEAGLAFGYRGGSAGAPERRHVKPLALRVESERWYLDAYDYDREAGRTFRIDRMADPHVTGDMGADDPEASFGATRHVRIAFADEHLLELLEWPQLVIEGRERGRLVASIPYYGGPWLARRIAACGGSATTDDEELVASVREVAASLLEQAC